MNVYLLRHGIAVAPGTSGIADNDRPLTAKGRDRMHEIARGFSKLGLNIDRIVTSPLPRALETAEIFSELVNNSGELEVDEALLADRSADSIARWLESQSDAETVLVGHNPAFTDLIGLLTTGNALDGAFKLRRGGIAALSRRDGSRYALEWMARPRLLRRL